MASILRYFNELREFSTIGQGDNAVYFDSSNNVLGGINAGAQLNTTGIPSNGLNIVSGGTLYTTGDYLNVPLTGGSGTGAQAHIVTSGGVVLLLTVTVGGQNYVVGDVLSAAAANIGGTGSGFSASVGRLGGTFNILIGDLAGRNLTSGDENVAIGGTTTFASATTASQNTLIGSEAGASIQGDTGHTLIGYQAGLSLNGNSTTWNTFIGHAAGTLATDCGGCVAIGRAAGHGFLHDTDCLAIGHGAVFYNLGTMNNASSASIAIGDAAAGMQVDGTATNWGGTGLTYWGMVNDTNVCYFGPSTGKASAAARTNSFCVGNLARIPIADNVGWFGSTLVAVGTKGRVWDGATNSSVNSNVGVVLTTAQLLSGIFVRTGAPGAGFADVTPSAAAIVAAGPGNGCEVPVSTEFTYLNNTGQTATLTAGSNVTIGGINGGTIATVTTIRFLIVITNSTSGSEAVTIWRCST